MVSVLKTQHYSNLSTWGLVAVNNFMYVGTYIDIHVYIYILAVPELCKPSLNCIYAYTGIQSLVQHVLTLIDEWYTVSRVCSGFCFPLCLLSVGVNRTSTTEQRMHVSPGPSACALYSCMCLKLQGYTHCKLG